MRISVWISDLCSSDLGADLRPWLHDGHASLAEHVAGLWQGRGDRYSELRGRAGAWRRRVELFLVGGQGSSSSCPRDSSTGTRDVGLWPGRTRPKPPLQESGARRVRTEGVSRGAGRWWART